MVSCPKCNGLKYIPELGGMQSICPQCKGKGHLGEPEIPKISMYIIDPNPDSSEPIIPVENNFIFPIDEKNQIDITKYAKEIKANEKPRRGRPRKIL